MPLTAPRPIPPSAVASGTALSAELLQSMADDGLSRQVIADLFGMSRPTINVRMRQLGIKTHGHRQPEEVHGTWGDKPPKLVPSSDAIRAASVFRLGVHGEASSLFLPS